MKQTTTTRTRLPPGRYALGRKGNDAAMAAATACDLLAKESAALRRDEASCLQLLRDNDAAQSDQKTTQRLQRALRNVRKQLDEVDLAHVIAAGHATAEAREDAHVRVDELESDLAAVRAELLAEKKRRKDAEALRKELEDRLKALREVSGEQTVTLSGGQAPQTTSSWNVPTKVRTIYVPTRPAPGDADDVDRLRVERDQLRDAVDRLTASGSAARAAGRGVRPSARRARTEAADGVGERLRAGPPGAPKGAITRRGGRGRVLYASGPRVGSGGALLRRWRGRRLGAVVSIKRGRPGDRA